MAQDAQGAVPVRATQSRSPLRAAAPAILMAVGFTSFGPLPAFILGSMAPLMRVDLGFTTGQQGISIAVFFLFAATGSAFVGRPCERIGAHRALRTGMSVTIASLLLLTTIRAWWQLTAILAFAGVAHATLHVGSNLLLARSVPEGRQGTAFGIKQSSVPMATLIAGSVVSLTSGYFEGWRRAYLGVALVAALVLVLQYLLTRRIADPSRPMAEPVAAASSVITANATAAPRLPARPTEAPSDAFDGRELIVMSVAVGFAAASANSLAAFLVGFAADGTLSIDRAGTLLAVSSAVGLVTRLTVGWLGDAAPRLAGFGLLGVMFTVGGTAFALLPVGASAPWLLWIAGSVAFAAGWGWPGLFTFIVARQNSHAPATATGVTQAGIFYGAVAGPLLFGYVVDWTGSYDWAWRGSAAAQFIGAVLIVAVSRRHARRTNSRVGGRERT
jgi:MFS family permease